MSVFKTGNTNLSTTETGHDPETTVVAAERWPLVASAVDFACNVIRATFPAETQPVTAVPVQIAPSIEQYMTTQPIPTASTAESYPMQPTSTATTNNGANSVAAISTNPLFTMAEQARAQIANLHGDM